jgi:hypothetical protein
MRLEYLSRVKSNYNAMPQSYRVASSVGLIILLSACTNAEPTAAIQPQALTPTTCTGTPLPTGATQTAYPSPNAEFAVLYIVPPGGLPSDGVFVIEEQIRCGRSYDLKGFGRRKFIGWSSDSQYAIFAVANQYNHHWSIVFDTGQWSEISIAQPEGDPYCDLGPMHPCESRQIVDLVYSPDRIVYGDGSTVYLSNLDELVSALP